MMKKKLYIAVTVMVCLAAVASALYIMANGVGLSSKLDFGAGAYYYADIPNFDKYDSHYATCVPTWMHVLLFLGWGFLMYKVWGWIERRKNS